MDELVKRIEKAQPFFGKVATNQYLRAIRDGFVALMLIIIFSSFFSLIANVPQILGFIWPKKIFKFIL